LDRNTIQTVKHQSGSRESTNNWKETQFRQSNVTVVAESTNNWKEIEFRQSNVTVVAESLQTIGKKHSSDSQTRQWLNRGYKQLERNTVQTLKRDNGGRESTNNWKETQFRESNIRVVAESLQTTVKKHSSDRQTSEWW
jgi:hypothetical protein